MSPVDNIERQIEQLHAGTSAETDRRILGYAAAALHKGLHEQQTNIWRLIVTSRLTRPVAAAAVILIAVSLFLSRPTRDADTVEGFYSTLAGIDNIRVSEFQAGQTRPRQQVWTSQSLQVQLYQTGIGGRARFALRDIGEKVQMTMFLSVVEAEELTDEMLLDIEKSVTPSFVLAPFFDAKDIPRGARWERVRDPAVVALVPGCVVYDLIWIPVEGGTERKWRVFADARSHLPQRTEFYVKPDAEADYQLKSFVLVAYPRESEIKDIVVRLFGQRSTQPSRPEHISTPGFDR